MLGFLVFFGIVLLVLGGIHLYLWKRLVWDTTTPGRWRRAGTIMVVGLAALVPVTLIGTRVIGRAESAFLAWPGYLWVALMFYLLVALLLLELPRLVGLLWLRRQPPEAQPGRRLLLARSAALVAGVSAAAVVGTGIPRALGPPRVRRVPVTLAKLDPKLAGFRIALMSDLHLGPFLDRSDTERVVSMINREQPDLIALVGDLVDGSVAQLGRAVEPLRGLAARHGCYLVTGNHEYYSGVTEWVEELRELGMRPLRNQRVEIAGAAAFDLAGVNDVTGNEYDGEAPDFGAALDGRDTARPVVLLAHQPVQVGEAARRGVDLQLSGHTHGGQIVPFSALVRLQQPALTGLSKFDDTWLYVTNGVGFWGPPVRVGADPDITIVELRPARPK